ncbi:MAG: hypothetical protein Q8913_05890 [Bacteroidota bacterium]|nr:hypothetical protein [Bacteroidota bacterium]
MKSRRSWLMGLALGVALSFGAPSLYAQTSVLGSGPRLISYQGLMVNTADGQAVTGQHVVKVDYYDASSAGNLLGSETFKSVTFTAGVFDLTLGSGFVPPQFPASMRFNAPYWIQITYDPGATDEKVFDRQEMLSAPYALNAERANGLDVFDHPVAGALWPVPLDASGRIDTSILPVPTAAIQTLNSVGPDAGGNVLLTAGQGISLTPDASTHSIMISGPNSGGIDTITAGPGITTIPGNGIGTNVTVEIGPGQITNQMFGPGAITGNKISQIAGLGLIQDNAGLLDVNVDNSTLTISNNQVMIAPGGVGTAQIANGAVNLNNPNSKVNGILPVPNGGTGVGALAANALVLGNGTSAVSTLAAGATGTVLTSNGTTPSYALLTTGVTLLGNGTTTPFNINLANANTWTASQTFAQGFALGSVNTGPFISFTAAPSANRLYTFPDAGANSSVILNMSTGGQSIGTTGAASSLTINSNGNSQTNPALTVTGTTTHNGAVNLAGTTSPLMLNGASSAVGQLMVGNGANTPTWLAQGAAGQVLVSAGAGVAPTWTGLTFNNILSGVNTGQLLQVGNGSVLTPIGTGIINANQVSGVSFGSLTPASGNIIVANGTSWNSVVLSGDATIASNGVLTLANTAQARTDIGLGSANTPTFAGLTLTAPLTVGNGGTGVNTFAAGVIHSTGGTNALTSSQVNLTTEVTGTLPAANGGTGNNAYNVGDVLYANGATSLTRLAIGGNNTILMSNGTAPSWTTASGLFIQNQSTTPGTQQVGNFNVSGAGIIGGALTAGSIIDNGTLNLAGAASSLQVAGNAGLANQALFSQGPGLPPVWQSLATNILPPTSVNQTLRATTMSPPTWGPATNFTNDGTNLTSTGNLNFTGSGSVAVNGTGSVSTLSGNISTATGALATGNSTAAGRVIFGDGASANLGNVTINPLAANRSYTLIDPGANANFILSTSPAGQTIGNGLTVNGGFAANGGSTLSGGATVNGLLTANNGASVFTGINNNGGGMTNAGAISGATTITASGLINGGSFQNTGGTFTASGTGAITATSLNAGAGLITTSGNITTTGTGTITAANGLTVSAGGANITGPLTLSSTSPVVLPVANGGPGTAGQVFVSNAAGVAPSWTTALTVATIPFSNITSGINTGQTLQVGTGSTLNFTGTGTINASTLLGNTWASPQAIGTGTAAAGTFTNLTTTTGGLNLNNNGITNTGSIAGATTITANGLITTSGNITTTGTGTITSAGLLTASNGLSVTTGGATINGALIANSGATISGGLSMNGSAITNASSITATGLINGGSFQNTGASFTASGAGAVTATSLNAGSGTIVTTGLVNGGSFQNAGNSFNVTGAGAITAASLNAGSGSITTTGNVSGGSLTATTGGANITGGLTLTGTGALNTSGSAGSAGQVLISNGGGAAPSWTSTLTVATIPWNNVTSGTNANALLVSGSLAPTGAGTITANQFVGTGSTTNAVDLGTGEVAGTLAVGNGGTGATTLTTNGVLLGNGTSPVTATAAGVQYNVLSVNASGVPTFTQVALNQSAAVTGALGVTNGGTGLSVAPANGALLYGSGVNPINTLPIGANGTFLTSNGTAPSWTSGAANFIVNGTSLQSPANFNISGNGTAGTFTTTAAGSSFAGNSVGTPTLSLSNSAVGGSALTVTAGTASLLNTTILGAANINTSGNAATNIGTGTYTGTTSIGNSGSTNTIAGSTGITGPTTINTTGANTTQIGNTGGGTTLMAGTVTHNSGNVQFATTSGNFSAGNNGGSTTLSGNSVTVNGNTSFTNNVGVGGTFTASTTADVTSTLHAHAAFTADGNSSLGTGGGATTNTIGSSSSTNTLNGATTAVTTATTAALTVQNAQSTVSPYTADNGKYALSVLGGMEAASTQADGNGQAAATSQRFWADTYTLTGPNQAASSFTIYNSLVSSTSTVLITVEGSTATTQGLVTINGLAGGQFTVNTTAATFGSVTKVHYCVINH